MPASDTKHKRLSKRIRTTLDAAQAVDQAGIRSGFSSDDHLLSIVLLIEAHAGFNIPLWMCTEDFEKNL